ncbi:MAG: hypothetical protein AB1679_36230 [Actinomycetota bacterium]
MPAEARTAGRERLSYLRECNDVPAVSMDTRTCTFYFRYTRTIETFVMPPTTGPIHITAVGAPGAGERGLWSYGATVTGSFNFPPGTPLSVVVGGEGWFDGYNGGGAGGGGEHRMSARAYPTSSTASSSPEEAGAGVSGWSTTPTSDSAW